MGGRFWPRCEDAEVWAPGRRMRQVANAAGEIVGLPSSGGQPVRSGRAKLIAYNPYPPPTVLVLSQCAASKGILIMTTEVPMGPLAEQAQTSACQTIAN